MVVHLLRELVGVLGVDGLQVPALRELVPEGDGHAGLVRHVAGRQHAAG